MSTYQQQITIRRIANLQRDIVAADKTGQAYSKIATALSTLWAAEAHSRSSIESDVLATEMERVQAMVDEMTKTSVYLSEQLANEERLFSQLSGAR